MPDPGVAPGGGTARDRRELAKARLRNLVRTWDKWDAWANENKDNNEALNVAGQHKGTAENRIRKILSNRPGLRHFVVNRLNYRGPIEVPRDPKQGEPSSGGGGGGGGETKLPKNPTDPPKDPADPPINPPSAGGRFLPGIKNKDYRVVNYNGKTYVVYNVKVGSKNINVSWKVPQDKFKAFGISAKDARPITKKQFNKLNYFGLATDITVHGNKRHPFRQWVERITAQYGGTGLLKNKEIMSILLMGHTENWDGESIKGAIRQTKWWEKTTQYQRRWSFELTPKERQLSKQSWAPKIREALRAEYGDSWQKYVSEKQVDNWLDKIASGRYGLEGNPDDGFNTWLMHQRNKAEQIAGTPAQLNRSQTNRELANNIGNPDIMFGQIREDAIEWLGYHGKPGRDLLRRWADDLAVGNKSQEDWERFMRRQKDALYPYLAPDEKWTERISSYKEAAERLIGRTVAYDDGLLADITRREGQGVGTPMNLSEWEKWIRQNDQRFWEGPVARDEGYGLVSFLNNIFQGVPGGGMGT